MYIFKQLFTTVGYEYLIAVLTMFVFILFYYFVNTPKKRY
jgi:hypothetical protein